jgi:hypothetical protein
MRRRTITSEAASRPYGTADKPDDAHMAPRRTRPTPGDLDAAAKDRGSADQRTPPMCPRSDVHLTYMINITLTTEFVLPPRGAW